MKYLRSTCSIDFCRLILETVNVQTTRTTTDVSSPGRLDEYEQGTTLETVLPETPTDDYGTGQDMLAVQARIALETCRPEQK